MEMFSDVQDSELRVLEFRKQVEEDLLLFPPEVECEMFFENNLEPLSELNNERFPQWYSILDGREDLLEEEIDV